MLHQCRALYRLVSCMIQDWNFQRAELERTCSPVISATLCRRTCWRTDRSWCWPSTICYSWIGRREELENAKSGWLQVTQICSRNHWSKWFAQSSVIGRYRGHQEITKRETSFRQCAWYQWLDASPCKCKMIILQVFIYFIFTLLKWLSQSTRSDKIKEAVRKGILENVKLLVDHGADINARTKGKEAGASGGTPLWWAKELHKPDHKVIEFLKAHGAKNIAPHAQAETWAAWKYSEKKGY